MRNVAIIEKAKTPYRPPLFEHIGKELELTVFYVGTSDEYRRWNTDYSPKNHVEKHIQGKKVGPLTIPRQLKREISEGVYNELIIGPELDRLFASFLSLAEIDTANTDITIWTENIISPWIKGRGRPIHMKLIKKMVRAPVSRLQKKLYKMADSIIAYSRLAGEMIQSFSIDQDKTTIAPQWYPPEVLPSTHKRTGDNSDVFRALFVGKLNRRKGVDTLLQTANTYRDSENIEFVIAGDGPLREYVAKYCRVRDNLHYLGYISDEEKVKQYVNSDLLILPSRHDPWGLVVNEAYIFDTPAITTTTVGAEMIVPDKLTFKPEQSHSLRDAIECVRADPPARVSQPSVGDMADPLITPPTERE